MFATTIDMSIPPAWNSAVIELDRSGQSGVPHQPSPSGLNVSYLSGNASTTSVASNDIRHLGWSQMDTLETYLRLRNFEEDWDHPGMEAYDEL